jgi:hypothetical protein
MPRAPIQAGSPPSLKIDPENCGALNHLRGLSAHSDIVIALMNALRNLPNADTYCPDYQNFGYVLAYTNAQIFAFAEGMHGVTLRLPPHSGLAAMNAGAMPSAAGEHWYFFDLYGATGFEHCISDWIVRAHAHAALRD